ncbi:hypothetical protein J2Z22_001580 [Paenibacillus forsythiae]|uniref:DUF4393 domain-containing protein n=1 Tax=Paenibacillus forsythiae TaxID=365616 RepID=A0ABU3H8Q6_9BACL|nr:DUF4393 domain-containing protein [Paenibacillus forsythiae]MDT3426060.1 hypothetical protein [Paenibacillus forsythiae]
MTENKTDFSLINIGAPKFLENATSEPAKEIGRTLANLVWVVFSRVNMPIEKLRIKQAVSLKKFELEITEQLNNIPEENLLEPQLSIVGPALEATKYYIEEDEIRQMFAKLIGSSMDNRHSSQTHHSFVEIIKQMSPLDAQNLRSFGNMANKPIANYINHVQPSGSGPLQVNVYLENEDCNDLCQVAISISNLQRLGIVSLIFDGSYLNGLDIYKKHEEHDFYKSFKEMYQQANNTILPENYMPIRELGIEIQKGIISLTPLGEALKRVCID